MPSLSAIDDGSGRPLTEDLSTGSDGEDIAWDADPAEAGEVPAAAGTELGLLVWEEAPGWHNVSTMAAWQDAVVRDVRDMVIRDRSRPSVIIWSTRLNECNAFGNQRRYRSGQVALTLSGPATLLGDNPFEFGQYGGLGAVWIRSLAGQPGAITLTASHPLLGQAEVQVRSAAVDNTSELG